MGAIEKFVKNDSNVTVAPDICRGAQTAWLKLRKYYNATDESPIYAVVTALHPSMRYSYWSEWEPVYDNAAKEAVRSVWRTYYRPNDQPTQQQPHTPEDDNIELRLLGKRKSSEVDQLESFATAPW
ncbi:hypothetical protein DFQ26_002416, partial [Actinomortierella ambigua]